MVKQFLYRILCGFFIGVSVFAPGFSGSIVAIIMGIYQDLLRIISNPFKQFKKNIVFCVPLAIGAAMSAVLFVLTFKYLFETYEKATYLLFVGLVAGNIPVIVSEIKKCGFKKRYIAGGAAAFAVALALGIFAMRIDPLSGGDTQSATLFAWAFGGLIGGMAALVPGMSVSMILIVFGIYTHLIAAAESLMHLNLEYLLPFGLFCVFALIGLVAASRGIKHIFDKYPGFANSAVFGFVSGALIGIFIQSMRLSDPNFSWLLGGAMLAAGLGISGLFVVLGKKMATSPEAR